MSWITKSETVEFSITTGDGKEYKPLWNPGSTSKEFNVSEFDYPNLPGTLFNKQMPRGSKFPMEFYFQGENHLDVWKAFNASADDRRAWKIVHPYYGNLVVQPLDMDTDHTKFNVSRVTINFGETITEDSPKTSTNPVDKISNDKMSFDELQSKVFVTNVIIDTKSIVTLSSNNSKIYAIGSKKIKLTPDAEAYFNFFNSANTAILNATAEPLQAIRALQTMIGYPALLVDSVSNRMNVLVNQFNLLHDSIETIIDGKSKRIYENNAGALISAMALTTATPRDGDYANRNEVYTEIKKLSNSYNLFSSDLDLLQTANGGSVDSYVADADSMIGLDSLVNYTISNLFTIALNAKQERSIILEEDSNIISLAHRFYGLEANDKSIEVLMNSNEIGLNELLEVRKGRKILYYV